MIFWGSCVGKGVIGLKEMHELSLSLPPRSD